MAGEIQLNSTTFATESGGTITVANVDSATNRQNLGLEIGVDVQAFDTDTTKNDVANTFTANQTISVTDNTNAALSVTQLGTGNAFIVNDEGSETTPFVIDASGNVGIGTTLSGNSANNLTIRKDSLNNVVDTLLLNNGGADNQAGNGVRINMSGVSEANSDIRYSYIESATASTGNDHYIAFGTNAAGSSPTERMRIYPDGKVYLNDVYGDTVSGASLYISSAGKLGLPSSIRAAKTNISNLESVDWIYDLNPVSFQYRITDEDDNYTDIAENVIQYGLIAEEVEAINSDLAFYIESENGMELRGVKYDILIAPLLKAVQQQKTLIESQQSQIDALTARIEALETT